MSMKRGARECESSAGARELREQRSDPELIRRERELPDSTKVLCRINPAEHICIGRGNVDEHEARSAGMRIECGFS